MDKTIIRLRRVGRHECETALVTRLLNQMEVESQRYGEAIVKAPEIEVDTAIKGLDVLSVDIFKKAKLTSDPVLVDILAANGRSSTMTRSLSSSRDVEATREETKKDEILWT